MGETLNLLFRSRENGTFELQVKEGWSGRTISSNFVPPYTGKQLTALQKKLNNLESTDHELRKIGSCLFLALCGSEDPTVDHPGSSEQPIKALVQGVIQRTLRRRGTVAMTFCFGPGCHELICYPWELLHNGDYFLVGSGIFTLTRTLLDPDIPVGSELSVHLPMRVLYISASPTDCAPLETEQSFQALEFGLAGLIETGQVFLDRLEPATFDELVRYLTCYGGVGMLDDNNTTIPCYVIHFDGHGVYGCLCHKDGCKTVNDADAHKCRECGTSLRDIEPQTYLCFCDGEGRKHFIDTQSLRDLFVSSDIRLAVFSACETAAVKGNQSRQLRPNTVETTLATALVMAQVPAVVAMPFALQDDLSPTFMYHFYEALADGRTLEEALARARQALLPKQQKGWFIPVLYRHMLEEGQGPAPLLISQDVLRQHLHPLAQLRASPIFIGREQELQDLENLLASSVKESSPASARGHWKQHAKVHHIALTGLAGIGKTVLALEAIRRNREKFPGGTIGISLREGKLFGDALVEILHHLRIPVKAISGANRDQHMKLALATLHSLANRELPSLLLLDGFEEVRDRAELEAWQQFLCALPQEVITIVTSRSSPEAIITIEGTRYRWYEYHVRKMKESDLQNLCMGLASASGLDQRIYLNDPRQQAILHEICTLLDGYTLGAELIFGSVCLIGGKVYTPEAATRSLEEIRDELRNTTLAGIFAALEHSYSHLSLPARLLLSYLATFKLPFSHEQIMMLVMPETSVRVPIHLANVSHHHVQDMDEVSMEKEAMPVLLTENWHVARDELVQTSFMQFDGKLYTIHSQVRHFALSLLSPEDRRRVQRLVTNPRN